MKQDILPYYDGARSSNPDYHHGQLPPVKGAACYQVARANRSHPECDDGIGGTYKHGADLAYWNGRFYVHYFTNPMSEHTGAGQSVLAISPDGRQWQEFQTVFPPYLIPACTITDDQNHTTTFSGAQYAFIHQRVGFYRTKTNRLLLLGFYGWSPEPWMTNWDRRGIGRVVRELYEDHTMGPIYFIRPCWQAGWSKEQLLYPLYTEAADQSFIACCEELLNDALAVQQWAEENGDREVQIKHGPDGASNQAFCWYHIDEKTIVGLWKHARCAVSHDGGKSWSPVQVSPSLIMSGQKVWAQKTADGRYAMLYDPTLESTHRWPLCVTTSADGLRYENMLLVHGEVPPMRYGGFWKDFGPQYVRGIAEGTQRPAGAVWVSYTVNKEDVWVARLPLPITGSEQQKTLAGGYEDFTVYAPKWAPVQITADSLRLSDFDPYDYAKAERVLYEADRQSIAFALLPHQNDHGNLYCELQSPEGQPAVRLVLRQDGKLCVRTTALIPIAAYEADKKIQLSLHADCMSHSCMIQIDDQPAVTVSFMTAVKTVSRFVLRTGAPRLTPTRETEPIEDTSYVLPGADEPVPAAIYEITAFTVKSGE